MVVLLGLAALDASDDDAADTAQASGTTLVPGDSEIYSADSDPIYEILARNLPPRDKYLAIQHMLDRTEGYSFGTDTDAELTKTGQKLCDELTDGGGVRGDQPPRAGATLGKRCDFGRNGRHRLLPSPPPQADGPVRQLTARAGPWACCAAAGVSRPNRLTVKSPQTTTVHRLDVTA